MVQRSKKSILVHLVAIIPLVMGMLSLSSPLAAKAESPATTQKPAHAQSAPTPTKLDAPVPSKDDSKAALTTPAVSWTVSLSANTTNLWPEQFATLTATANADVGPTPYYLSIYDLTAHSNVAICAFGMTCMASVTQSTAMTHSYQAYVSLYPTTNPPAGLQASSGIVVITWRSVTISLSAAPTTLNVGGTTTLTSTTSADIGPSPFWAQIYDITTGTRIGVCGFGTTCTATTSQAAATTHSFVAYVSDLTAAFPPTGIQATSNTSFVTWSNSGYRVTLSSSRVGITTDHLTATTNVDVGPTPYYIEVFNIGTGARVAVCGSGTTCSVDVSVGFNRSDYIAFVSSFSTTLPPLNTQASSNVVSDRLFIGL